MTRKRKAADYPPEFLETWELAAKGSLNLSFDSKGKAFNFRQRLHAFRRAIIDEGGQAAFSHWFAYDLEIVEEFDQKSGVGATGKWLLRTTELDWKAQVRAQAAAAQIGGTPVPPSRILNPASTIPEGLGPTTLPSWIEHGPVVPNVPLNTLPKTTEVSSGAKAAMDEALNKLGFKS
jgi:hypothetical protein